MLSKKVETIEGIGGDGTVTKNKLSESGDLHFLQYLPARDQDILLVPKHLTRDRDPERSEDRVVSQILVDPVLQH
jgi:hypothetical protein